MTLGVVYRSIRFDGSSWNSFTFDITVGCKNEVIFNVVRCWGTGHNGDKSSQNGDTLVKTATNIVQNRQILPPYVWQGNGQNGDKPKRRHK